MTTVFFSYSHKDEALRDQLEIQLAMLKRQGIIETWHDRRIVAGQELDGAISDELLRSDIVLLLVSPDFLASDYCYDREMGAAMERHEKGEAVVIPVILRPCDWHPAPFGKLRATQKLRLAARELVFHRPVHAHFRAVKLLGAFLMPPALRKGDADAGCGETKIARRERRRSA